MSEVSEIGVVAFFAHLFFIVLHLMLVPSSVFNCLKGRVGGS